MDLIKLLHFLTVLSLAVVASHADLDAYWKSKLPNTPMPKAVRDLLNSESLDYKSSSILVGKGGINANTGKHGHHIAGGNYAAIATPEELEKYASLKDANTGKHGHHIAGGNYAAVATPEELEKYASLKDANTRKHGHHIAGGNYAAVATPEELEKYASLKDANTGKHGHHIAGGNYAAVATPEELEKYASLKDANTGKHGHHIAGGNYAAVATPEELEKYASLKDANTGKHGHHIAGGNYAAVATPEELEKYASLKDANTGKHGHHIAGGNYAAVATPEELEKYASLKDANTGKHGHHIAGGNYAAVATPEELGKYASLKEVIYFFEKELHPGTSMNLQFDKTANTAAFLPRKFADSIPFSSKHLPEILNKFSVTSDSAEAKVIKKSITECERPAFKGEYKYCATSLESLMDFCTSKLGKNAKAFSTEAQTDKKPQKYSIVSVSELKNNGKAAVCHKLIYPYAVFDCHILQTSKAFMVSLVGADGAKAKALAICHIDTAEWNPKHLAFQVLKVKPGTVPICHFLPEDTILWVPK